MSHSNPNLVPTVITDKNGKTTTVHKKRPIASSGEATLPAPVLQEPAPQEISKSALLNLVVERMECSHLVMERVKIKAKTYLYSLPPERLAIIHEAVGDSYDESSEHEQSVVLGILTPLTTPSGDPQAIHELLTLREAFCSEWSIENEPSRRIDYLESFIYGIRDSENRSRELDLSDETVNKENIALLRFAYELAERSEEVDYLPTYRHVLDQYTGEAASVYKSDDLKNLIRNNVDRVGELIELAFTHQTSESHELYALLEHEGHSSLTYGML